MVPYTFEGGLPAVKEIVYMICQVGLAQLDRPDSTSYEQQHNCMASALNRFPVCLQITSILQNGFVCTCMLIYCANMGRYSWYSRANI